MPAETFKGILETVPSRLTQIGATLADETRSNILTVLMDDRARTGGELARYAGVAPSTASEHLSKLLDAGLVTIEAQGSVMGSLIDAYASDDYASFFEPKQLKILDSTLEQLNQLIGVPARVYPGAVDPFESPASDLLVGVDGHDVTSSMKRAIRLTAPAKEEGGLRRQAETPNTAKRPHPPRCSRLFVEGLGGGS